MKERTFLFKKLKSRLVMSLLLAFVLMLTPTMSIIGNGNMKIQFANPETIVEVDSKDSLNSFLSNLDNAGKTAKLTGDIDSYNFTNDLNSGDYILDLNGHNITVTSYEFIRINTGASFTILDSSGEGTTKNVTYSGVNSDFKAVTKNATYTSGVISGSTNLFVINGGDLYYQGGISSDNEHAILLNSGYVQMSNGMLTQSTKSAIYVNSGNVDISGGYLYENTSSNDGGAITLNNNAKLNINGNTVISKNSGNNGGAIYANNNTEIVINNGYITDNISTNNGSNSRAGGGGIYSNGNVTITMNNGYLVKNSMSGSQYSDGGGAILLSGTSSFNLNGGYITENTANGGAGVKLDISQSTVFTMKGGTISYNTATTNEGGGVYVDRDGKAYIYAGNIIGNVTNTVEHWGGGGIFCADAGYTYMENANITENSAGGCGGGIAGCSTGYIYMTDNILGAVIYNNSAEGANWSETGSTKSQDHIARDSEVFMSHGYQDYFCALNTIISGKMLGDGAFNWEGTCDFSPIKIGIDQVIEATEMMGLTANPSQEDIEKGLARSTLNIIGNHSNTHGGGILCNGSLVLGQSTVVEIGSLLEVNANKYMRDDDIANYANEFIFELYDSENNLVATGTNDSTGKVTFDTGLYVGGAGAYTFTLKEKLATNPTIATDPTVYKLTFEVETRQEKTIDSNNVSVDKTIHEIKDGSVKVQKVISDGQYEDVTSTFTNKIEYDKQNDITAQVANVKVTGDDTTFTNAKVEKASIEASKVWIDNNNSALKRPESVVLQLKNGEEIVAEAEVNEANGWKCTFEAPKYDIYGNEVSYTVDEKDIGSIFYTKTLTNATTVTNTFSVPDEKVEITGTKVWEDNNDAKRKRPSSIILQVKNGNTVVAEQEVTATDDWKYTFTNLAKYDENGNEIVYTIDEKDTGSIFYKKTLTDNVTVTNTFEIPDEKINITGTKAWVDNNNEYGLRSKSITLQLKKGEVVIEEAEVNEASGWKYTFTNLAKYDENGDEIVYTIDEKDTGNTFYQKTLTNATTVTNTFVVIDESISIEAIKVWNDNGNAALKRPESVILQIKDGRTVVAEAEVSEENGWRYTFENLAKYRADGSVISYVVDEKDTGNIFYTKSVNGNTVTNTFKVLDEKINITGIKVWDDNNNAALKRPESVILQLKCGEIVIAEAEVNGANSWKYTFENLAKYDENGNEIVYTIDEKETGSIFYKKVLTDATTVTNIFEVPDEKVSVTGTKVWIDNNNEYDLRPESVILQLKNGEVVIEEAEVNEANSWKYTFENLAKYDENGDEIVYTIDEKETGSIFYKKTLTDNTTVTNTYEVPDEFVNIEAIKVWNDNENVALKRPESIVLQIKDGTKVVAEAEVSEENGWKYTFENLAKYRADGSVISYAVDEKDTGNIFYTKSVNGNTVTNTFKVPDEKISITGIKIWEDNKNEYGKRPSNVVLQVKNGDTVVLDGLVNEANDWKYTFENLAKYDVLGNEINYIIDEEDINSIYYTKTLTDATTVTNTFVVPNESINLEVNKIWNDNENVALKRPESVVLQVKDGTTVVAEAEVSEESGWKYTFELPKYRIDGSVISYVVDEKDTGNIFYTKSINGNTIINTFEVPDEKISITGIKVWIDNENIALKRPESAMLQLKNGEQIIDEAKVSEETGWKYTFEGLKKYDELGNEINYTIDEEDFGSIFYQKTLTNDTTVTNTFEVPDEKIHIVGTKVWDDDNNKLGKRPEKVVLEIKANRKVVAEGIANEETNWSYEFELPKYDELGNEVVYELDEKRDMNRFYQKIEVRNEDMLNQVVLNKFVIPDDIVLIDAEKKWEDNDDEYKLRPDNAILQVIVDGEVIAEVEVNESNGWKHTFELPKYDENGNEIKYVIDEKETSENYEKIVDGQTVIGKCTYEVQVETSDMKVGSYIFVVILSTIGLIFGMNYLKKQNNL